MEKGSSIILHANGKVLMQHRDDIEGIKHPGRWGIFGGHVDEGESPNETIIREMDEELGLRINNPEFFASEVVDGVEETVFSYEIDFDTSRLSLREGREMRFFSPEELEKENVIPWEMPFLREFFSSVKKIG